MIIYHLFDEFTAYKKKCEDDRKSNRGNDAVFPCTLKVIKDAIFNRQDPILMGCEVEAGQLRVGTPLCLPEKDNLRIGVVEGIEHNKKSVKKAFPKDGAISIRIGGEKNVVFGRHFDHTNQVASWITRRSLDSLKEFYRDELDQGDINLLGKLVKLYKVPK